MFLKQSTNSQVVQTPSFVSDTDFKTVQTGLTIANTDVKLIQGGSSTNKNSGGGTHVVNGTYSLTLNSTDTGTVGRMLISISVSGALPVFFYVYVLEEAVYDMLFGASALGYIANQPVDVNTIKTQTVTCGAGVTVLASVGTAATSTAQTGDAYARIGSNGSSLTGVPWNASWDAEVQSEVQDAIEANNLDHLMAVAVTNSDVANNSGLAKLASKSSTAAWSSFDNTTESLEALRDRGDAAWTTGTTPPTVGAIADAVWEELITDHSGTSGSVAEALNAAGSAGDPWTTSLPGSYTSGQAGYIVGTNLNATVSSRASQTSLDTLDDYVDTEVATIVTQTSAASIRTAVGLANANLDTQLDALPTNAELATALGTADDAVLSAIAALSIPTAAQIRSEIDSNSTQLAAIVADTNELQTDWANGGRLDLLLDTVITDTTQIKGDLPQRITKNTALSAFPFFMVSSSDHVTGATGLTVTATRSLDGGSFGSCTNSVSEIGNGWYKIDLAAGDLNGNTVALKFTATGADARMITVITEPT